MFPLIGTALKVLEGYRDVLRPIPNGLKSRNNWRRKENWRAKGFAVIGVFVCVCWRKLFCLNRAEISIKGFWALRLTLTSKIFAPTSNIFLHIWK